MADAPGPQEKSTNGLSVLVVEDHPFQRKVAVGLFTRLGVTEIHEAENGKAGLAKLRDVGRPVDIVMCDLRMPEMDGVEFIRHVAEDQLSGAFIVASAMDRALIDTVEAMARVRRVDVLGTVEKPVTMLSIERLMTDYMKRRLCEAERRARPVFDVDETMVRAALAADEFVPYFQPKISVKTGQVLGFEVLVRWNRTDGSIVPPGAFIPLAERTGLIEPITEAMLNKALAVLAKWRQQHPDLTLSVNISPVSLSAVDLPDRIDRILRSNDLSPDALVLEITETAVLGEGGRELDTLARLRLKGFGLSVDDFGTGYASFQQLHTAPFTEVKIDQCFVTGATHREKSRTILESSISLAAKLRLHCVAEGVETADDLALLAEFGCDVAQGYYIARPMPAADTEVWLREAA